jgi:hypothetical protein
MGVHYTILLYVEPRFILIAVAQRRVPTGGCGRDANVGPTVRQAGALTT